MSDTTGDQPQQQRPWASPRQQPVKGIVQPRVLPPFGKPTRHTNKLDYIMNTVLKEATKHKHAWPFQKPVDAVTLCIPLYHEKVVRPMDLRTIENRLKSTYYTCAQECIDDIETVFNNCYIFNGKEDDVTIMAQNVHEVIKKSLETAPREEHDMEVYWGKNKKKAKSGESKTERKKELRGPSEPPSECGSEASGIEKNERKAAAKKPAKRKADSDDEEKPEPQRVKREATVVKKETTHAISPIMKPCLKMLNDFYGKKYFEMAWPFHEPVNAEGLGLHDYHKIVKEPMDMRTIKNKLESNEYREPSEFERDMRLMLNNCLMYNPVGDPINLMGKKFLETFEKKWADIGDANSRASSVAPPTSSSSGSVPPVMPKLPKAAAKEGRKEVKLEPVASEATSIMTTTSGGSKTEDMVQINNALSLIREREDKVRSELDALSSMKEKLTRIKSRREDNPNEPFPDKLITDVRVLCTTSGMTQSSSSASVAATNHSVKNGRGKKPITAKSHSYNFDSDDEENRKAMSYEDKRGLSMMINKLPPAHLSTIIAIIERRENSAIEKQHQAESEIEIDFESLGDMCLREMDAFVRSVLNLKKTDEKTSKQETSSTADNAKTSVSNENKDEKKIAEKSFNMSESSDDETSNSRKRRKKESSESESSSSSDDESDDDAKNIPRKSGQPPSTSREWNQPQPRLAGMGGQPPMSRVPPSSSSVAVAKQQQQQQNNVASTYHANKTKSTAVASSSRTGDRPSTSSAATSSATSSATTARKTNSEVAGKSILDTLLPDSFGTAQGMEESTSTSPVEQPVSSIIELQNGENEAARIQRLRMEAKRAREREDENAMSMTNQMEMMTAFELNNVY